MSKTPAYMVTVEDELTTTHLFWELAKAKEFASMAAAEALHRTVRLWKEVV